MNYEFCFYPIINQMCFSSFEPKILNTASHFKMSVYYSGCNRMRTSQDGTN